VSSKFNCDIYDSILDKYVCWSEHNEDVSFTEITCQLISLAIQQSIAAGWVTLDNPRKHYNFLNKHLCWKNIHSYRHWWHFQNWQMLASVCTVLSLLLDWILTLAPTASKSSGHYYRRISLHICNQDCTCCWWKMCDIMTALISRQVSGQAILHSPNLYKIPSTTQTTVRIILGKVWCQASSKTYT
jgi:hypothetical protein